MKPALARLLSHIWPVRVWKGHGRHGPLELTWEYGRLVANSAHANQSYGSLHRVWRQAFRDARVRERSPTSVLILGFGAGSAADLLRNELGSSAMITGVDVDPTMLAIARAHFPIARDPRIQLLETDALRFVKHRTGSFDLVIVDLFTDLDLAPGVEEPPFLQSVMQLLAPGGILLMNAVVHDEKSASRSARLGRELRLLYTDVEEYRYERSNRVFVAL